MEDREGDLWVGTETDGLEVLRDQRFHTLDTRTGLSSDRITTVVEDGAGKLWAGTREDGLNALGREADGDSWRALRNFYSGEQTGQQRDFLVGRGAGRRSVGGYARWADPIFTEIKWIHSPRPMACPMILSVRC